MLNVTLNNAVEMLKTIDGGGEIIVCDNSDQKIYEILPIAYPTGWIKQGLVKVIRQDQPGFTSARHRAAEVAKGEYLFCVDSHVLFGLNTLRDSVAFMDRHKDDQTLGFGHPPIRWAHQGPAAVKHTLKISPEGLPNGGWDCHYVVEREMYWKFMPWICRRDWYLNTLKGYGTHATAMLSWGGAEVLQQVKSLMMGYKNWAIPTDPIAHIGPYNPQTIEASKTQTDCSVLPGIKFDYKYRTYAANGNYPHGFGVLVAYAVLGGETDGYKHAKIGEVKFTARHNIKVDDYWKKALAVGMPEHEWLNTVKKYDYLELLQTKPWEQSVK